MIKAVEAFWIASKVSSVSEAIIARRASTQTYILMALSPLIQDSILRTPNPFPVRIVVQEEAAIAQLIRGNVQKTLMALREVASLLRETYKTNQEMIVEVVVVHICNPRENFRKCQKTVTNW